MYYRQSSLRGVPFIFFGSILFFMVAGNLIYRLLFGMLALYLINYGLRLQHMPPMHTLLHNWIDRMY